LKNLNTPQPLSGVSAGSRVQAAKAMASALGLVAPDLLEPGMIAWKDRTASLASPELEGCSGPEGWRDYGISHDGRLEVDGGGEAIFIFTESSPCDRYEHFGPGHFANLRDDRGNEMICRVGGVVRMSADEWTSKLT
jgi:hypothetical protein